MGNVVEVKTEEDMLLYLSQSTVVQCEFDSRTFPFRVAPGHVVGMQDWQPVVTQWGEKYVIPFDTQGVVYHAHPVFREPKRDLAGLAGRPPHRR